MKVTAKQDKIFQVMGRHLETKPGDKVEFSAEEWARMPQRYFTKKQDEEQLPEEAAEKKKK